MPVCRQKAPELGLLKITKNIRFPVPYPSIGRKTCDIFELLVYNLSLCTPWKDNGSMICTNCMPQD